MVAYGGIQVSKRQRATQLAPGGPRQLTAQEAEQPMRAGALTLQHTTRDQPCQAQHSLPIHELVFMYHAACVLRLGLSSELRLKLGSEKMSRAESGV